MMEIDDRTIADEIEEEGLELEEALHVQRQGTDAHSTTRIWNR
jgi:hypothetical protein